MGKQIKDAPAPCFVLGAGEIADYAGVRARMPAGCYVICADGGFRHCAALGVTPDLLVGDFDSLDEPPRHVPRVTLSPDKDYTDTTYAAEEAVARGYTKLLLSGALGGRLDHTLANLALLGDLARRGIDASITDGLTDVYALAAAAPAGGTLTLEPRAGCYFSLLSLVDACSGVTISGGKYPLHDYPLSSLEARAVSNEFTGSEVVISADSGVLVVVVTPQ